MSDLFRLTLAKLEQDLRVEDIATMALVMCDSSDLVQDIRERSDTKDIDQIPVRQLGRIVGVLERTAMAGGTAGERMVSLHESNMIKAEASLAEALDSAERQYRLVTKDGEVCGILTPSDLGRLPCRVYAFCLLAHLETLISATIDRSGIGDDGFLELLEEREQKALRKRLAARRSANMTMPVVEIADLKHKIGVLCSLQHIAPEKALALEWVRGLRSRVVHGHRITEHVEGLRDFVKTIVIAREWIDLLSRPAAGAWSA